MNNRGKKLASDFLLFSLSNFGSKVLVFLMVPLYTGILSTEEYGIGDLFTVTINILFPLLTLSITEATLRFLLDKDSEPGKILAGSLLFVGISVLMVITISPLVFINNRTVNEYLVYFVLMYVSSSLNTCFSNFIRGVDRTRVFAVKGIIHTVSLILFNICFLLIFKWQLVGYLLAIIFADFITIAYMIFAGKLARYFTQLKLDKNLVKDMLKYCLPMIPTILAWWVMQMSDKYILIWFAGIAESGVYSVAYKIPSILSIISTIFNQAWQISAVKNVEDKDYNSFFKKVYELFFASCIGVCSILIVLSKLLGGILFLKDYYTAWKYVPVLLIAYFCSGLSGVMASAFSAHKKTSVLFYSTIVGAVLNIVLNLLFIPQFGALAAAITTTVGFMSTCIIRDVCLRRFFNMRLNSFREIIAILILSAECYFATADFFYSPYVCIVLIGLLLLVYRSVFGRLLGYSKSYVIAFKNKIVHR